MSEINITVEGGTSKRLLTAGKYCDRDIVVTAEGGGSGWDGNLILDKQMQKGVVLGEASYEENEYVKRVQVPECKGVGAYAFSLCPNLESVNLGGVGQGSVAMSYDIDEYAFQQCPKLTDVRLLDCSEVGHAAFLRSGIETLEIGKDGGCRIGKHAFANCNKLRDIRWHAVNIIEEAAFSDCVNIEEVRLYNGVNIGENAFRGCTKLKKVVLDGLKLVCNIALSAFNDTPMLTGEGHVYVDDVMYEEYRNAYESTIESLMPGLFAILFRPMSELTDGNE